MSQSSASSEGDGTSPDVVVAMLTYRRRAQLERAVGALLRQLDRVAGARLVVIDNDVEPSARDIVRDAANDDPRVIYAHEPRPGISAARNRALEEAASADVVVFIDDDELPSEDWLPRMVATWQRYRCAAVAGPVVPIFEVEPDDWARAAGTSQRARHTTGSTVTTAGSGNLLLDVSQLRALHLRFDERFGMTGGEDTLLTRSLTAAGAVIVWCDEALAHEHVPAARMTPRWMRERARREGNTDARVALRMATSGTGPIVRLRFVARGGARVAVGGIRLLHARLQGAVDRQARATWTLWRGVGMMQAVIGETTAGYARA